MMKWSHWTIRLSVYAWLLILTTECHVQKRHDNMVAPDGSTASTITIYQWLVSRHLFYKSWKEVFHLFQGRPPQHVVHRFAILHPSDHTACQNWDSDPRHSKTNWSSLPQPAILLINTRHLHFKKPMGQKWETMSLMDKVKGQKRSKEFRVNIYHIFLPKLQLSLSASSKVSPKHSLLDTFSLPARSTRVSLRRGHVSDVSDLCKIHLAAGLPSFSSLWGEDCSTWGYLRTINLSYQFAVLRQFQ